MWDGCVRVWDLRPTARRREPRPTSRRPWPAARRREPWPAGLTLESRSGALAPRSLPSAWLSSTRLLSSLPRARPLWSRALQ
ncbi:hypothetical protein GCM10020220_022610 [Nonomuraea rubra]